jgi:hypothetical protein
VSLGFDQRAHSDQYSSSDLCMASFNPSNEVIHSASNTVIEIASVAQSKENRMRAL